MPMSLASDLICAAVAKLRAVGSATTTIASTASAVARPKCSTWKGAVDKENDARDNLYQEAVRIVLESQRGSVSLLQRRLEIGYSRAAKLIDLMAENGLVGEYKGSQAREVFLSLEDWEAQMSRMNPDESDNA